MNTIKSFFAASALTLAMSLCFFAHGQPAFGNDISIPTRSNAPLGLQRLAVTPQGNSADSVAPGSFEIISLETPLTSGRKLKRQKDIPYLEIAPRAEWGQKLRQHHSGANYVTFTINGSLGTKIELCGVVLTIEQSSQDSSYAAIYAEREKINYETPFMLFNGARMAALDIVTITIHRSSHTWSIWFRDTLAADHVPLPQGAPNRISVTAGNGGAWVCGIVCTDENPLFVDRNDNAIPDDFEQQTLGRILRESDPEEFLATVSAAWREQKHSRRPSEFLLTTPLPDSFPEWCEPEGAPVHGMPNGLKFGGAKKN